LHGDEQFKIIKDVLHVMTGIKFSATQRPLEIDEFKKSAILPSASTDEELSNLKDWIPPVIYNNICRSFKRLWGFNMPEA